jgi:uncharacterized membrane protein
MMKSKLLSMILLTALFAVSMITAATFSVAPNSLSFAQPDTQKTFTLTPTNLAIPSSYSVSTPSIIQENGQAIPFTVTGTLAALTSAQTITINSVVDYSEISIGKSYSGNIVVANTADTANDFLNIPVSFTGSFCKEGEQGTDLDFDVEIDNSDGDDDEWSPLDEIEIEVEVSNNGPDKLKDVMVELGLFDSNGKNVAKDLDDLDDEEIDLGSIKDDDDDMAIFTFTIPADFESENYRLVIKAYSDDEGEDTLCIAQSSDLDNDYYHEISGEREEDEDKHIILDNVQISPTIAQCEEIVQVTGELFNIGDEDYEDQVRVTLSIPELGLNFDETVREDFDQGDSEVVEFEFTIPEETTEKLYDIEFRTYYDYDDGDDTYDLSSDDVFLSSLRVEGNCEVVQKAVSITAELDDETPKAVPGKQVIINAEIKNTGDVETTYTVSISGNSGWSELVSLDPQIVTLASGESRDVAIVLSVDEDAEGEEEFKIKATFDSEMKEQTVSLTLSDEKDAELGPVVEHLKSNWFIYLIILVNIILIIAIILVIRSMVAPRPM